VTDLMVRTNGCFLVFLTKPDGIVYEKGVFSETDSSELVNVF